MCYTSLRMSMASQSWALGQKYISHFFASKLLLNGNNFIPLYPSVFKGIPDEPGRLCDGETSE